MTENKTWKPDLEEAIEAVIRATIAASGRTKPDELPHLVRSQLSGQVSGDLDIDQQIKLILEKMKKAGEI